MVRTSRSRKRGTGAVVGSKSRIACWMSGEIGEVDDLCNANAGDAGDAGDLGLLFHLSGDE
jgi:hypothetical protein